MKRYRTRTYFIALVAFSILIKYLIQEVLLTDDLVRELLGDTLAFSQINKVVKMYDNFKPITYLLLPLYLLLKVSALYFWISGGMILYEIRYESKQVFNSVIRCEFVWLIPAFITFCWFFLSPNSYSLEELSAFRPLSLLNLFNLSDIEPWMTYSLQAINLFELIYVIILNYSLSKIIDKSFTEALKFTIPVYCSALFLWIVFTTFLSINMSS